MAHRPMARIRLHIRRAGSLRIHFCCAHFFGDCTSALLRANLPSGGATECNYDPPRFFARVPGHRWPSLLPQDLHHRAITFAEAEVFSHRPARNSVGHRTFLRDIGLRSGLALCVLPVKRDAFFCASSSNPILLRRACDHRRMQLSCAPTQRFPRTMCTDSCDAVEDQGPRTSRTN